MKFSKVLLLIVRIISIKTLYRINYWKIVQIKFNKTILLTPGMRIVMLLKYCCTYWILKNIQAIFSKVLTANSTNKFCSFLHVVKIFYPIAYFNKALLISTMYIVTGFFVFIFETARQLYVHLNITQSPRFTIFTVCTNATIYISWSGPCQLYIQTPSTFYQRFPNK